MGQGPGEGSLLQSVNEPDGARRSPKPAETGRAPGLTNVPKRADTFALAALLFAGLCVAAAYGTTRLVRDVLFKLEQHHGVWEAVFLIALAGTACLFWPAIRAM